MAGGQCSRKPCVVPGFSCRFLLIAGSIPVAVVAATQAPIAMVLGEIKGLSFL